MLFKQIAKDYMQCSICGVRSMNIYDLIFLFKKETGKIRQKLIKNVYLWKDERKRGRGDRRVL